ncbi:hypothetical protein FACS1894200_00160 [Spirochaetia bacterium]|nr:hypothetical protein FACS1894200_00160 [Spirochaetia bacterium]
MADKSKILSYVGETPEEREANGIEREKLCVELERKLQAMIDKGIRMPMTVDEANDIIHEERAGGEGFKRLWG